MADSQGDQDPKAQPADGSGPTIDAASERAPDAGPDRREFLRQMSGDAVRTAGRFAGFSSIIRRSVVAAGGAAIRDLEAPADGPDAEPAATAAEAPGEAPPIVAPRVQAPAESPASPTLQQLPDPVASLTPEQHYFLATGAQAVMAVNDPGGAPHLTSSLFHWDGAILRLPGRMSTARAIDIDRDPHVSVLVEDRNTEAWVAITGVASFSPLDAVELEMLLILTRYFEADGAARRWEEMRQSGDQIVIQVRPVRFVWRPA